MRNQTPILSNLPLFTSAKLLKINKLRNQKTTEVTKSEDFYLF